MRFITITHFIVIYHFRKDMVNWGINCFVWVRQGVCENWDHGCYSKNLFLEVIPSISVLELRLLGWWLIKGDSWIYLLNFSLHLFKMVQLSKSKECCNSRRSDIIWNGLDSYGWCCSYADIYFFWYHTSK